MKRKKRRKNPKKNCIGLKDSKCKIDCHIGKTKHLSLKNLHLSPIKWSWLIAIEHSKREKKFSSVFIFLCFCSFLYFIWINSGRTIGRIGVFQLKSVVYRELGSGRRRKREKSERPIFHIVILVDDVRAREGTSAVHDDGFGEVGLSDGLQVGVEGRE